MLWVCRCQCSTAQAEPAGGQRQAEQNVQLAMPPPRPVGSGRSGDVHSSCLGEAEAGASGRLQTRDQAAGSKRSTLRTGMQSMSLDRTGPWSQGMWPQRHWAAPQWAAQHITEPGAQQTGAVLQAPGGPVDVTQACSLTPVSPVFLVSQ